MPRVRSKRWCFTLNNPTDEELEFIQEIMTSQEKRLSSGLKLTYLVFGKEAVSTMHLQGYAEVETKVSLSSMKCFLQRAHWEKAKGTSKQASDYCKKDGDFEEWGQMSVGQGTRTDLLQIKKLIEDGTDEKTIADQHFSKWVVYRRSFQAYATLISSPRSWATQVEVLWGPTGTGKTRFAMDATTGSEFWIPGDYKWFDFYKGQTIVIFDDYRGEYPLQMLLKLLDRYPMRVPIKGGFTEWKPKKVFITSNTPPEEWYPFADAMSRAALMRRLTLVKEVNDSLY